MTPRLEIRIRRFGGRFWGWVIVRWQVAPADPVLVSGVAPADPVLVAGVEETAHEAFVAAMRELDSLETRWTFGV